MNVWDFGPLGTTITSLQRGRFPTFATALNIILSYEPRPPRQKMKTNFEISQS